MICETGDGAIRRFILARRGVAGDGRLVTPEAAAARLGVSVDEVYRRVPIHLRLGRRTWRFYADDVDVAVQGASTAMWAERFGSAAKSARVGAVYFIEAVGCDRFKIGWTSGPPARRAAEIQTSSPFPLVVRASAPGSMATEAGLHARFATARVLASAEWFHSTPDLLLLIGHVVANGSLP